MTYKYSLTFYLGYLSEDEAIIHYLAYSSTGYRAQTALPLFVGAKIDSLIFTQFKNSFQPETYYPKKFRAFPAVEYVYGIVANLLIAKPEEFEHQDHGQALIFLVASSSGTERFKAWQTSDEVAGQERFLTYPNPSPQNLSW